MMDFASKLGKLSMCPVCLDEKELISLETCSHGICQACIVKTLSTRDSCPVCRKVWCPDMIRPIEQTPQNLTTSLQQIWLDSNHFNRDPSEYQLYQSLTRIILDESCPFRLPHLMSPRSGTQWSRGTSTQTA